jgi:hypothetical protein
MTFRVVSGPSRTASGPPHFALYPEVEADTARLSGKPDQPRRSGLSQITQVTGRAHAIEFGASYDTMSTIMIAKNAPKNSSVASGVSLTSWASFRSSSTAR